MIVRPARPHRPHPDVRIRTIRYNRPVDYHRVIVRRHIYRYWVFQPAPYTYGWGYREIDDYPWWIYNGYRFRYHPVELCDYELVDGETNLTVRSFGQMACSTSYDICASERDTSNAVAGYERYFCAERVGDEYSNPDDGTFDPTETEISPERMARIDEYLRVTSDLGAYNDAVEGRLGPCSVWRLRENPFYCEYRAKVNDQYYPDAEGEVCSAPEQADLIGCHVGTEQENAGCIIKHAVYNGYCF